MRSLSTPILVFRRLLDGWKLLISVFVGVAAAATLVAAAPIYLNAIERQGLNTAIDRSPSASLNVFVYSPYVPLEKTSLGAAEHLVEGSLGRNLSRAYRGSEQHIQGPTVLVSPPNAPLPTSPEERISRGYLQYISNLEQHVRFVDGRMATRSPPLDGGTPVVEAVVGTVPAALLGLRVGDVLTLTPSRAFPTQLAVHIVGLLEPVDPTEEYWQGNTRALIDPPPLLESADPGVEVDPEESPLALFTTKTSLTEVVGRAYPGTQVDTAWFAFVDREVLKDWSMADTRDRVSTLESEISASLPGATVPTGIVGLLDRFEQRSFFSNVPLLLLLALTVTTVLYYLAMMVSYLVRSRQEDVALLRSRGAGAVDFLRLYALEGMVLTGLAVVVAPFLALGLIAAAGKLPYFRDVTGGNALPVQLSGTPFLVAAGLGLLILVILVGPGLVGSRGSPVVHRLRSSRPPSIPIFQRYYVDVALLVLGGLVFWELQARGQLVSGGLFGDVEVNEALLLAPVLLLVVVGLLFMRLFPMVVRFVTGESAGLLHLVATAVVISLVAGTVVRGVQTPDGPDWAAPIALVLAIGGAYWLTNRTGQTGVRLAGLAAQAGLVASLAVLEPPTTADPLIPALIALMALVPAQLAYVGLRAWSRIAPAWVAIVFGHMGRNPLQYGWLMLLLVMVTGLGVLAATVGGTLDRSHRERVLYEVGADLRVTGLTAEADGATTLREGYAAAPSVASTAVAFRGTGRAGLSPHAPSFDVLAVEPEEYASVSWYRSDFSSRPLASVLSFLTPANRHDPVMIPDGATALGVWVRPHAVYPNLRLWFVVQDATGAMATITLGELGAPEWHLIRTEVPLGLRPPLELVSVQVFERVYGPSGAPGVIGLDDVHAVMSRSGPVTLEDFEGPLRWTALSASALSSDSIVQTREDVYRGDRAGLFAFGKDTEKGIRGFYSGPGTAIPVVANPRFLASTGSRIGRPLVVKVMDRPTPIVVRELVDYFPTMSPDGGGFILADLESLMRHLNLLSPTKSFRPNEVLVAAVTGAAEDARGAVLEAGVSPFAVQDSGTLAASIGRDPLVTAGWRAMSLSSFGIVLLVAGLGYVAYLLAFANQSRNEIGFLRALGMSSRQLSWLLGVEHFVIAAVGLGLGTWAGLVMSRVLVSAVAVTETGQRVIPPFVLTTDWSNMLVVYGGLCAIFLAAIYVLARGMLRQELHSVSRLEA